MGFEADRPLLKDSCSSEDDVPAPRATRCTYAGIFLVALATLLYETLLTRIFSVTMWYHFAFMAISVAMFGMTVGAIWVYLRPAYFSREKAKHQMARSSLFFALSTIFSFLTYLAIPFVPVPSVIALVLIGVIYVVISIPFVFSGTCVCLALTRFPQEVSRLYAADLAGAAIGCLLLIYTLRVTDGPTAVGVVALLAGVSATVFASDAGFYGLRRVAVLVSVLLGILVVANTVLAREQRALVRLLWVNGKIEVPPLYEKWNSFSRIVVRGNPNEASSPLSEGVSSTYPAGRTSRQLGLYIDAIAETTLTAFDGDLSSVDYLKYDVKNIVHFVRPDSSVLVVGAGGGRDVLSALAFRQRSVLAVEINGAILDAVNRRFGNFTGHLDRISGVTFVNDEARSYIARLRNRFDIIQVSLIDTSAATAAGAFTLTENSLYTVEAWTLFLERLTPHGILSFSRWYHAVLPDEAYRLISLAAAALERDGIDSPRDHIIFVTNLRQDQRGATSLGVGSILVSKAKFSAQEVDAVERVAKQMHFEIILSPRFALDSTFAALASGKNLDTVAGNFPLDISPPTDNRPFFFYMIRLRDAFKPAFWTREHMNLESRAVFILGALLIVVVTLTFLCIIIPLVLTAQKETVQAAVPYFIFFGAIGFGFMLVEISQMQRLIVFLGHPSYALSVILFALLLSCGLGSYLTGKIRDQGFKKSAFPVFMLLLCVLVIFGKLTPSATEVFQGSATPVRILIAISILFPLGLLMGMPFPLGMKAASAQSASLTPWLWGINGATSVCASVVAVAIALNSGISTAFWAGALCYAVAVLVFVWASKDQGQKLPQLTNSARMRDKNGC